MKRILPIMILAVLLLGVVGVSALAAEGDDDRILNRIERLKDRFANPITFWIKTAETIHLLPVDRVTVQEEVAGQVDLGSGCLGDEFIESVNWVLVTLDGTSGLPEREVQAIFPEPVKRRSVIFDVTFMEYCFSETEGRWYARFDGTLIKHAKAKKLTRLLMKRVSG